MFGRNKKTFLPFILMLTVFFGGCSSEICALKTDRAENYDFGNFHTDGGIMVSTSNLLANHLLLKEYEDSPESFIAQIKEVFLNEPRPEHLLAVADAALQLGRRYDSEEEKSIKYYLTSALCGYAYLALLDDPGSKPYSADRVQMMRIYNLAVMEIFDYLTGHDLLTRDGYTLAAAHGMAIRFRKPDFRLPLPASDFKEFKLCADYKPQNLTHTTRHFGIGASLICDLEKSSEESGFAQGQMLPGTLVLNFDFKEDFSKVEAQLVFYNPRETEYCRIGKHEVPLSMDFSTPIAYMAGRPLPFGYISYMLDPENSKSMQGLYRFEAFDEKRIPVVLVHGLMSNCRTWIQMLNTLQNDPDIRKYYQFWGFSYSSGNPILYSAMLLRTALEEQRRKLISEGKSTAMFDRMVLVGHSMGGLLSKTAIMDSKGVLMQELLMKHPNSHLLSASMKKDLAGQGLEFEHLPFVKRVVFIAVPHGGSLLATSFIGRFGRALIKLPVKMTERFTAIISNLIPGQSVELPTGIDGLAPDNETLKLLRKMPFVSGVPYHSIIGNRKKLGVPGGTDGIVPYSSSHLDGAASELVVRSGHDAHNNPLAIQEVKRILIQHLKSYRDLNFAAPELKSQVVVK